ncbi:MAG: DNA polymerase III subunit delta [Thermodesulfobacteriota bacterium]
MKKSSSHIINANNFINRLSKDEYLPVYVFYGDQYLLMDKAIQKLKEVLVSNSLELNFSLYYGDSASASEVVNNAKTYPMFSSKRLVVIKNAEKLSSKELKLVERYILQPSPFTCLVLIFLESKKPNLEINQHVGLVNFTLDIKDIIQNIKNMAGNHAYNLTNEAVNTLISLVGEDLQDLESEINKLILFLDDKKRIDSQDVERLTERIRFEDIYKLLNSIANRDKKNAVKVLMDLETKYEEPLAILNSIIRRFRLIWRAKELMERKVSRELMLKELKVSTGALYYIQEQAKNLQYADIKNILQILFEGDRAIKTSQIPDNQILTKLVLEMCS